ncbi:MAG: class I SAM-dependent methyltransferase, partial [Sneathiellales bacterium]|nr:class I SAM-dependent methyltransferase [Sneathiellales bacterium]
KKSEKPLEALLNFRKAAHLAPQNARYLNQYADIFDRIANLKNFDGLDQDLLLLLSNESVQWKKLNWVIPQHLKSKPAIQALVPILNASLKQKADPNVDFGKVTEAMADNVMLAALKRIRLVDPELEKLLEIFRRQTLAAVASGIDLNPALTGVLIAIVTPLAQYCFANEYVFQENTFETQTLKALLEDLQAPDLEPTVHNALKFVIACCYRQPNKSAELVAASKHFNASESKELQGLIKQTITEPLIEEDIKKTIPPLTPISDDISLLVQEMYEENPYPRWLHFPYMGSTSMAHNLATILPVLGGKQPVLPKNPQVLIAGCGTGQQPISTALAFPETRLLAVDLSLSSIAYAKRKTTELKIPNIEYGQADIMELRGLNRTFDIIECAGVLHHMHDPVAGWKVLCDLLDDNGFMLIGLYSEIGRQDIVAARDFITSNGYSDSLQDIRDCRKSILALEDDNLAKHVLRHGDFYTASACRDLIFHVQEHRFTIPQITDILDMLGLEFLGFTLPFAHVEEMYKTQYPEDKTMTNMDNWIEFEENYPSTFSAMYKFWVRKKR